MGEPEQIPTQQKPDGLFHKALKIAAYPVAAVVGGLFGHMSLRNSVYSRLKKYDAFNDFREKEYVKPMENLVGAKFEEKERQKIYHEFVPRDVKPELKELYTSHKKLIRDRMHGLGFKNIIDYWKGAHSTEKLEAGLLAFTAAGITLGVILTAANSKGLLDLISHTDQQSKQNTQRSA